MILTVGLNQVYTHILTRPKKHIYCFHGDRTMSYPQAKAVLVLLFSELSSSGWAQQATVSGGQSLAHGSGHRFIVRWTPDYPPKAGQRASQGLHKLIGLLQIHVRVAGVGEVQVEGGQHCQVFKATMTSKTP